MGQSADLRSLLAAGRVHLGQRRERAAALGWGVAELAGRLTEIGSGAGPGAVLTALVALVLDAQGQAEPVAWVGPRPTSFYPPDLDQNGVDLGALVVVRAERAAARLGAAEHLLRSAAFGLLIVELEPSAVVPMAAQVRLAGLAQRHRTALVLATPSPSAVLAGDRAAAGGRAGGSLASLRVEATRQRLAAGRFRCAVRAVKDKQRGGGWGVEQVLRGPLGLR